MTTSPFALLKQVEDILTVAKVIPLWGAPPAFPWEKASEALAHILHLPDFKISVNKTEWLSPEEHLKGLGEEPFVLSIELSPLATSCYWAMGKEDVEKLVPKLLSSTPALKGTSHPSFLEGFYWYVALQALHTIDELKPFQDLSLKMGEVDGLPQEKALAINVAIHFNKTAIWGRVICPSSFVETFRAHFAANKPSLLAAPLAQEIQVDLRMEMARTTLPHTEWDKVKKGDCLVLDQGIYDFAAHKGNVTLALENTPLFRGKIKDNSLKILDYAFYFEETTAMDKTPDHSENTDSSEEETKHLWAGNEVGEAPVEKTLQTHEIPLTIAVELTRLRMSVEKLLQLQPGNVLELETHAEKAVDLTVNGKRIAKGELVKIGDMLGVKILSTT